MQVIFDAIDYGFSWTEPTSSGPMGWYKFDRVSAEKAARKARDTEAKRLRSEGRNVSVFSIPGQLMSKGGIGSGRPHIEFYTKSYGLNY